jgi:hypothetical protein
MTYSCKEEYHEIRVKGQLILIKMYMEAAGRPLLQWEKVMCRGISLYEKDRAVHQ